MARYKPIDMMSPYRAKSIIMIIVTTIAFTACNVTRTMTTESKYIQRNDTSIVIQTKTIETYDASKKR